MIIHVGSQNQVKVEAVREVFARYDFLSKAEVIAVKVDSGIAPQPLTLDETILGAKTRAIRAFAGSEYSIGLESGTHRIAEGRYMELTACALYDGKRIILDIHRHLKSRRRLPNY